MHRRLPIFPLGTVLLPTAVLPLHVFEPRYRSLMGDLLGHGAGEGRGAPLADVPQPEMGVVLIERGHEVGGGDERSAVGTIARIEHAEQLPDGRFVVIAEGTRRFTVLRWLPDDPYPLAEVEEHLDEAWDPGWEEQFRLAEHEVRRALALASELGAAATLPTLSPDRQVASWQLCAALPAGPFDRQRLLTSAGPGTRLALLAEQAHDAASLFALRLGQA